jgi:predicted ABC-type ATPase
LITVLAGANGAGKSSIGGASLRAAGGQYFNPDEQTRDLILAHPGLDQEQANMLVWRAGVEQLRRAIANNTDWTFETTLGGQTITGLLLQAIEGGIEVNIWYCGLDSADQHIERVKARLARGGHDIPHDRIRYRYVESLKNICRLAPACNILTVYDNSTAIDEHGKPYPQLLLTAVHGELRMIMPDLPHWARPIAGVFLT